MTLSIESELSDDLKACVRFHGHLCPGLVYGYRVAKEAIERLGINRSYDEEIVAISENDSCAVDGLQALLGTTAGKGNLIIRNYGKNVYTVQSRGKRRALRFTRIFDYEYQGNHKEEFEILEGKVASKTANPDEMKRQKQLKAMDLATKNLDLIFMCEDVNYEDIDYAPLAPSKACASCGELTMQTRMVQGKDGDLFCVPCGREKGLV